MSVSPAPAVLQPRVTAWPWIVAAALLVLFRTLPYAWWGTLAFDADQAVVGLMAKHIAEFRAMPVYQYGLPYIVIVSAYVTAPFMWVFGPTTFALKLPVLLMNVGVGVALVRAVTDAGLRPAIALLVSLPVLMPSAVSNASLMDALGMTVEPLVFVLVLWYARRMPVLFGVVAAIGFHVREFVAYGVAAVLAIDALTGELFSRQGRRHWLMIGLAALGTTAFISGIARYGSVRGPDTWLVSDVEGNLSTLGGAFCFAPRQAWRNVGELGASFLGLLWGGTPIALAQAAVQSRVTQGFAWAWPALGAVLVLLVVQVVLRSRALWSRRRTPRVQLGLFLAMVGAQAVLVYAVSRCGPVSVITVRYALLGVFLPAGLALLAWASEPHAAVRRLMTAALVAITAVNAWTHAQLWREQLTAPIVSSRARLGPALEARGIRYARSDYWTAYYVDFMTSERVIVGADSLSRIDIYERELAQHPEQVVRISTTPCGTTPAVVPGFYVCREIGP